MELNTYYKMISSESTSRCPVIPGCPINMVVVTSILVTYTSHGPFLGWFSAILACITQKLII